MGTEHKEQFSAPQCCCERKAMESSTEPAAQSESKCSQAHRRSQPELWLLATLHVSSGKSFTDRTVGSERSFSSFISRACKAHIRLIHFYFAT